MENRNIQLRDWNSNMIEEETLPLQQLKKKYLDEMKIQDIEKNFKRHKCETEDEHNKEMTTITNTTLMTSPISYKSKIQPTIKMTTT